MTTESFAPLNQLLVVIDRYRRGEVRLDQLQAALWETSGLMGSPDERRLRDLLQSAEGELELAQFTMGDPDVARRAGEIVDSVEMELRQRISDR